MRDSGRAKTTSKSFPCVHDSSPHRRGTCHPLYFGAGRGSRHAGRRPPVRARVCCTARAMGSNRSCCRTDSGCARRCPPASRQATSLLRRPSPRSPSWRVPSRVPRTRWLGPPLPAVRRTALSTLRSRLVATCWAAGKPVIGGRRRRVANPGGPAFRRIASRHEWAHESFCQL